MTKKRIPDQGDVYWIDPNPVAGCEVQGRHRFVVITPEPINKLGIVMTVPVTTGGKFSRGMGLVVHISGHDTTGVAVCNQVRSFDLEARIKNRTASYVETLDQATTDEIISRVVSVIDPGV